MMAHDAPATRQELIRSYDILVRGIEEEALDGRRTSLRRHHTGCKGQTGGADGPAHSTVGMA